MSSFISPSLLAAAAPLPNAPSLSTRGTTAKNEASFSRQLEQSRQAHAQEGARPAPPPKPPATPSAAPARPPAKPEAGARNEPARTARPAAQRETAAPADGESARTEAKADARRDEDTDATDPSIVDPFAPVALPPDAPAPPPADAAGASLIPGTTLATAPQPGMPTPPDASADSGAELAGAAGTGAGTQPATGGLQVQPGARDPREPVATPTPDAGAWQQAQAAAAMAESSSGNANKGLEVRSADPAAGSDRSLANLGLTGLSGPAGHSGKVGAGDVPSVNLATPATSAEFRAALGAQVSYFARAGVQQAELHLNPADMGPVSIQIVVDGQQAQVNFGADSALTRQIIESGMPELAGALRDAGLTLTGGGVSQHSGGQRQDANGNGTAGGHAATVTSDASAESATPTHLEQTRRSVARSLQGGVDLFA